MNIRCLTLILFIVHNQFTSGQAFEKVLLRSGDTYGSAIQELNGKYYLSTIQIESENILERVSVLYCLDNVGNIVDSFTLNFPDKWYNVAELFATPDGLFGFGITRDKITNDHSAFYFLTDNSFNLTYLHEAGTDSTEEWFSDMNYPGGDTIYAVYDKKIAEIHIPTGNMQICSVYTEGQPNLIYLNNGIIHTWQDYVNPPRFRSYDLNLCTKIDSTELTSLLMGAERSSLLINDSSYFLVGRSMKFNTAQTDVTWDLGLMRINKNMVRVDSVIFTTHPDTSHRIAFNQALAFHPDKQHIFYGSTYNHTLPIPSEIIPERRRFQILKTDLDGNLIWRKVYGENYGDVNFTMYAMSATSDGGIIMTGSMWDYGANPNDLKRQIYVLKTDSTGNAITGLGKDYTAQNISVYPNPTTDAATINHPELPSGSRVIIYNLTGSITGELFTHSSSTQLDFTGYAPGVYIINIPALNFRYKLVKVN